MTRVRLISIISFPRRNIIVEINQGESLNKVDNLVQYGRLLNIKKQLRMNLTPLQDVERRRIALDYNREYLEYSRTLKTTTNSQLEVLISKIKTSINIDLLIYCIWYIRKIFHVDGIICNGLSIIHVSSISSDNSFQIDKHEISISCSLYESIQPIVSKAINTWVSRFLGKNVTFVDDICPC